MKVKELRENEMEGVVGGGIAYSFINALSKAVSTIYDLGERTGSSIRRLIEGSYCPIN